MKIAYEQKTTAIMSERFNNKLWRELIDNVCCHIDASQRGITAISPFGFELLGERSYLNNNLRRFYIYIGQPAGYPLSADELGENFKQNFFKQLQIIDEKFFQDVVITIKNDNLTKLKPDNYQCSEKDKLLDIQVRSGCNDILTDYAEYLLASLTSILCETGEARNLKENTKFRWRAYQLYIMHEKIFGHMINPLSKSELIAYTDVIKLISNRLHIFYQEKNNHIPATNHENLLIDELIKPRIQRIIKAISPKDGANEKIIRCRAYHYNDVLELSIDKDHYLLAMDTIKKTYLACI